jgi:hypothetical protein
MGRKNRMKSTFANEVRPGTFWICHKKDQIILNMKLQTIEKDDVVIVLDILPTVLETKVVKCHSQKLNTAFTTPMENFYFNYHKL